MAYGISFDRRLLFIRRFRDLVDEIASVVSQYILKFLGQGVDDIVTQMPFFQSIHHILALKKLHIIATLVCFYCYHICRYL